MKSSKGFRWFFRISAGMTVILIIFLMVGLFVFVIFPAAQESGVFFKSSGITNNNGQISDSAAFLKLVQENNKNISQLSKKLDNYTPKTNYLIVNTTENKFHLYAGKKLLRDGICSTGSYTLLESGKNQKWIFKTPKGIFKIRNKKTEPVWKKPDWAFVEEGLPVPSPNHPSRYEYGTLGDYALSLGDGYMIHGTIYQRFLGLPVTHGCIRLGDDDLYAIYKAMSMGSKVYIY